MRLGRIDVREGAGVDPAPARRSEGDQPAVTDREHVPFAVHGDAGDYAVEHHLPDVVLERAGGVEAEDELGVVCKEKVFVPGRGRSTSRGRSRLGTDPNRRGRVRPRRATATGSSRRRERRLDRPERSRRSGRRIAVHAGHGRPWSRRPKKPGKPSGTSRIDGQNSSCQSPWRSRRIYRVTSSPGRYRGGLLSGR